MIRKNLGERVMARSSLVPLKVPAFQIVEALQKTQDQSIALDALALTFTLICQSTGIDPHALVTRAVRQAADADVLPNPHLEAIRDFAVGEMT